jgi:hypothetical protein
VRQSFAATRQPERGARRVTASQRAPGCWGCVWRFNPERIAEVGEQFGNPAGFMSRQLLRNQGGAPLAWAMFGNAFGVVSPTNIATRLGAAQEVVHKLSTMRQLT